MMSKNRKSASRGGVVKKRVRRQAPENSAAAVNARIGARDAEEASCAFLSSKTKFLTLIF